MKKEEKLLRSLDYVDGDYLLETEQAMEERHSLHIGRRAALLVAAVLILALTASGAYLAVHWDQMFLDRFSPSEAVMAKTAVQEVSALSKCEDVTLHIHQTLGDEASIYLTLEVTLPDSVPLRDYAEEDPETGKTYTYIMPEEIHVFGRLCRCEEIRGLTVEEAVQKLGADGHDSDMFSIESIGVDLETNTLSYLVGVTAKGDAGFSGDLTLMIGHLVDYGDTDTVVSEGPYLVSWRADGAGEVRRYGLWEGDRRTGEALLSAFGLQIHLDASDCSDCRELMEKVTILYEDGQAAAPQGFCGASITTPPGAVDLTWQFNEIQLLEEIAGIQVEGYTCKPE